MSIEEIEHNLYEAREEFLEYAECDEEVLNAYIERVIHKLEM